MLVLSFEIVVGKFKFTQVTGVSLESSWKSPGAKATITLPGLKGLLAKGTNGIKRGDAVEIKLGYNGSLVTEFSGYVTHVSPNIPMTIECEDSLFLLRSVEIKKDGANTTLTEVLNLIKEKVPSIELAGKPLDMQFTGLRLNYNAATVLQKFADEYSLVSYFRGNKLYVGLPGLVEEAGRTVIFAQGKNVISTNLEFKTKEERKIRFKVIGIDPKTKKRIELNMGDADEEGELRTLFYVAKDAETMRKVAQAEIDAYKYDGYEGSFTAFGLPYVQHSDLVEFQDQYFPERSGTYEVDAVRVSSGTNGYRREITLGRRVLN